MTARVAWLRVLADRGGGGGVEAPGYITYPVRALVDGDGVHGRRVPPCRICHGASTPSILFRVKT